MPISERDYYRRGAPRLHVGQVNPLPRTHMPHQRSRLWVIPLAAALWLVLGLSALWVIGMTLPEHLWGPTGAGALAVVALVAVLVARRILR